MTKRIYLEPGWKMRSIYKELVAHPPQGYEFVSINSPQRSIIQLASGVRFSYDMFHGVSKIIPVNIAKSYLEKFRTIPENIDLTYSFEHLIFRKEPWIVDTEYISLLVSFNVNHFDRYKGIVQRALASEYCRKIICWSEAARRTVSLNLQQDEIEQKLVTVPLAVHKKEFTRSYDNQKIKLLFVGSVNILGEFGIKGGKEALEAFVLLNKKYGNLELVIRSDVTTDVRRKYSGFGNIRIIEERVPWELLEKEWQSADIFLLPVHNSPFSVFLDAMSYELPIVTIDAWANSEIVEDGKTGLIVSRSKKIPYYVENYLPSFGTPRFKAAMETPDPEVVQGLVEKTSSLIENPELRRRLGKAGRWEIEHGRFSIKTRNEKLTRILDEATA